jgi:hypothetical protein
MNFIYFQIILLIYLFTTSAFAETNSLCDVTKEISKEVEIIRELKFKRPVSCIELEHEKYIARTDELQQKANSKDSLEKEELIYKFLKIIPENYPYTDCSLNGFGDTSIAFYDYERKVITFRKGIKTSYAVIAHELTHALQDQHFNIASKMQLNLTSDAILATSAVREGDAMLVEEIFAQKFQFSGTGLLFQFKIQTKKIKSLFR